MASLQPVVDSVDLPARRALIACTALAACVPVVLVLGVVRVDLGSDLVEQVRTTLALSGLSLAWSAPLGIGLGLRLARADRPWLRGLLGVLQDLPTVSLATLAAYLGGGIGMAGLAVGLVVLPHVGLGTATALERLDPEVFRAAGALGIPRSRAALRLGLPRVRGAVAAALLRGWGRGVGEAMVTGSLLGAGVLSGAVLMEPETGGAAAALLLLVGFLVPLAASRLEAT